MQTKHNKTMKTWHVGGGAGGTRAWLTSCGKRNSSEKFLCILETHEDRDWEAKIHESEKFLAKNYLKSHRRGLYMIGVT
jgi:hypothetical protein